MATAINRKGMAVVLVCVIAGSFLLPQVVFAQNGVLQPTSSQAQAMLEIAQSAQLYAKGLLLIASEAGLNVTQAHESIISGDNALAQAKSELGLDVTSAIASTKLATGYYMIASGGLSSELQEAGLLPTVDASTVLSSVVELNDTASRLLVVVIRVCQTISAEVNSSSTALQECSTAEADLNSAMTNVEIAAASAGRYRAGETGTSLTEAINALVTARGQISEASSLLQQLSAYGYPDRARAFILSNLTPIMNALNASLQQQTSLITQFEQIESSFRGYSNAQSYAVSSATSSALAVSQALGSISFGNSTSAVSSAQSNLLQVEANLTLLSQQVNLYLPLNLANLLLGNITATQSSAVAYNDSLIRLESVEGSYTSTTVDSFGYYVNGFQSAAANVSASGNAFVDSYSQLQAQVNYILGILPLLQWLLQWNLTLSLLGQGVTSTTNAVDSSDDALGASLTSAAGTIVNFESAVASVSPSIKLDTAYESNVTAVLENEQTHLNATALAALAQVNSSLKSTSDLSNAFIVQLNALASANVSYFSYGSFSLSSGGTSLVSQTSTCLDTMSTASAYMNSVAQAEATVLQTAQADMSQAMLLFSNEQIAAGVSLLAKASVELQASP
jgi:hypothetical protein